ncbi:hypothetical protein HDV00_011718 [Rhizophlyctis rosea]|nr:hypothetical protein HDV00_011718 [Rhizophlyctis rosea]
MGATKNFFHQETVFLSSDHRLDLATFCRENRFEAVFYLPDGLGGAQVKLYAREDGWTNNSFEGLQVLHCKVQLSKAFGRSVTFSEAQIEQVYADFSVSQGLPWDIEALCSPVQVPRAVSETISLYCNHNTCRAGPSRRTIISLLTVNAVAHVSREHADGLPLIVDEDYLAEVVKEDLKGQRVQYYGNIDFAVGHSRLKDRLPASVAMLVIHAKKNQTFVGAYAQTVAQAAASLLYKVQHRRGFPIKPTVYFITTDGEQFRFGKLYVGSGRIYVSHSPDLEHSIRRKGVSVSLEVVYGCFVKIVQMATEVSPTILSQLSEASFPGVGNPQIAEPGTGLERLEREVAEVTMEGGADGDFFTKKRVGEGIGSCVV